MSVRGKPILYGGRTLLYHGTLRIGRTRSPMSSKQRSTRKVESIMRALARAIDDHDLPAVEKIAEESQEDPFEVLISTMLSAQTRDPVTAAASQRLFNVSRTPRTLARLTVKRIERLIYPVSFYRHKAKHVKET